MLRTVESNHVVFDHIDGIVNALTSPVKLRHLISSDDGDVIGTRVKKLRVAKGLSQRGLARLVGVTPSAISYLEMGHTKALKAETLARVAAVLGADQEYIRTGYKSAHQPGMGLEEGDLLAMFRRLSPQNRRALIAAGNALVAEQQAGKITTRHDSTTGDPPGAATPDHGLTLHVVAELARILREHGPAALAGAVDLLQADLEGKAAPDDPHPSAPGTKPRRTTGAG